MDRFAVFVDAGYLYAAAGQACCNTRARRSLHLNGSGVSRFLADLAERACGLPLLRIYWYDGARDGIPTMEQRLIAALPNVKLRLGRLNAKNQQKGVDALIYRDLMTLARKRAICDAYLLSGDEDLGEGVRAAQDMGVRVTLIGVTASGGVQNQSKELLNEADDAITLTRDDMAAFIERRKAVGHASAPDHPMAATSTAAVQYAQRWLDRATDEELESLRAGRPKIPVLLDASLLDSVESEVGGSLRGREDLRRAARRAFWERIGRGASGR